MSNVSDNSPQIPDKVIKIDQHLHSEIKGFEEFSKLLRWEVESNRHGAAGNHGSPVRAQDAVLTSNVTVVLRSGLHTAAIKKNHAQGESFKEIVVCKLSKVNGELVAYEAYTYKGCRITSFKNTMDGDIEVSFSFEEETCEVCEYSETGVLKGKSVMTFNYKTGEGS